MTWEGERTHRSESPSTSFNLLDRVLTHDALAWQTFAKVYGPLVYRWALAYQLQPHDAADIMQEVFSTVAGKLDQFRRDRANVSFRGWLHTITRNKVTDHLRHQTQRPLATGGTDAQQKLNLLADSPESSQGATGELSADLARRLLPMVQSKFAATTWQAFWRTTVLDEKPADVAADLGLSVASVYQSKCRVLRYLRQEIGG